MTPNLALFYSFDMPSTDLPVSQGLRLGPSAALDQLLERGCSLATKPWVENHWGLILWKLAGMVMLDPERESHPAEKRWRWVEVMRQLFYRCATLSFSAQI